MNKVEKKYFYGKQLIDDSDIEEVVKVLKSDYLTQGPVVAQFENLLAKKFNSKFCSVVANGTGGLHLIGLSLGWKKKDVIITTPMTFVATANSILYSGAEPDFCDIDKYTYTLDITKLEEKIIAYKKIGTKIKAVIGVDYAGLPCDWFKLKELANKYNFQLVNDNCHALGAEINEDIGYACKYADIVNMSFHPVKHITTGEGGALLTNNEALENKIKLLRTHGITKNENDFKLKNKNPIGSWYYEMQELGFNYRITDFQCALGIAQLKKLNKFIKRRREIADYYNNIFSKNDRFIIPNVPEHFKHSYHLYPLQINFAELKISKKAFFERLKEKNINLQVHYIPVHLQPFYRKKFGFKEGDFPIAEKFYENEISIPIYPTLKKNDLKYICKEIIECAK